MLATWQKVNATAILCFGALVMGAILFGAGEDAEKAEENFVAAEMRSPAMRKHTEMKRMHASQGV